MEGSVRRYLEDVRVHWSSVYDITVNAAGTRWEAQPREGGTTLMAATGPALREAIRADYWQRTRIRAVPAR